ncbi:hypothetical protein A1351_23450, partial [Methylosinus sp. R-45379]|uniref:helix-turn-helix domain-containing protein n=1 Tax=Methylosinus sp. R-45379 TaxID=980563 RepID=UPI0007C8EB48
TTGDEIRKAREAKGLSQEALAERIGISQVAIQKIENGSTRKSKFLPEIERELDMAPHHKFVTLAPSDPSKPMPIMATAEDGKGYLIMSNGAIDYMARPPGLGAATDAYGLLVSGYDMFPRYRPGETLMLNPKLPPATEDGVVLFEDGGGKALIREFVRSTPTEWVVRKWGDKPCEERLSRAKWLRCDTVAGVLSRR